MRSSGHRPKAVPLTLAGLSFLLAVVQEPGSLDFDTKVNLHVAPVSFLSDVASAWSPTADLGHVQSGQYSGYLFPMGPFFALGHELGMADWLVERLWLGVLFALGAWGVVVLLDALLPGRRGVAHFVAGAAFVLNPYVVTFSDRTSVTLLAYSALPWLVLAVHRGLRHPRGWWWPSAFALVAAASGGGVNAAVIAWALVAPLVLLIYEPLLGDVPWRAVYSFVWRAALTSLVASLWWIGPVLVGNDYGINFLQYIEQPGTIWGTTSVSEALRLMGYWISYTGVGFAGRPLPELDSGPTLLFTRPVVVASLLFPALALGGFVWTRRWRYGPFFVALVLVGVLIVVAGFPEGTPLRSGLHFTYNRVGAVQFLRTSYKAAPLIALGLAALLGAAVGEGWRRVREVDLGGASLLVASGLAGAASVRRRVASRLAASLMRVPRPLLGAPLAAAVAIVLLVGAWPLTRGDAIGLTSKGIPTAWRQTGSNLNTQLPGNSRAMVLPGQLFSFYSWGGTVDPILPVLTDRPVAERSITPYGDLHATDLLWTIDSLVSQQRLYPGELAPLLSLAGVRSVVTGSDDDRLRSGSVDPAIATHELAGQGLTTPARSYGPDKTFASPPGELYPPTKLPEVRRYDLPAARGIVRVEPESSPLVVDGSAEALAGLAALGQLPSDRAILYAGDLTPSEIRAHAAAGAHVVISDSNRRRVLVNAAVFQNLGPTVGASDGFSADAAVLDPFPQAGSAAQTVQVLSGVSFIRSPYSPGLPLFPEHRPYAAFDGSTATAWIADRALDPSRRYVQVGFKAPRDVPYINLMPEDDARGTVHAVEVNGRSFSVHAGWNRLTLGLHHVGSLTILLSKVKIPTGVQAGAGGLREVRIPGLHVREALRVPQLAQQALHGQNLAHTTLTYLFERTTGDDPLQRAKGHGSWQAQSVRNIGDGETGLSRVLAPPAARDWTADAWLSLSPDASDAELDRLAGYRGPVTATSSGRFDNAGANRASSAFDGSTSTAWVGEHEGTSKAWIAWTLPHPVTVRRLRIVAPRLPVRVPARVQVVADGVATAPLAVASDGTVVLPVALSGRSFRLVIVATRLAPGAPDSALIRRAVGIAEIQGAGVPAMRVARAGRLPASCGIVSFDVGGRHVPLALTASIAALDDGGALRAHQCVPAVALPARTLTLTAPGTDAVRIDWLALSSQAPDGVLTPTSQKGAGAPAGGGRVLTDGQLGRTSVSGVRVALNAASWLVLGESYDRGWRASCNGSSLGAPVVIDGYANGWIAPKSCTRASFSFAPQRNLNWIYVVSGLACLVLLALVALRRRPAATLASLEGLALVDHPRRRPAGQAVALGLAAGAVLGFCFSLRSGVVIAVAVAFIVWRGVGAGRLIAAAAVLLGVVVPVLYLTVPHRNHGGFDFNYAIDLISAHWVAVAAFVLVGAALVRTLGGARAAHRLSRPVPRP